MTVAEYPSSGSLTNKEERSGGVSALEEELPLSDAVRIGHGVEIMFDFFYFIPFSFRFDPSVTATFFSVCFFLRHLLGVHCQGPHEQSHLKCTSIFCVDLSVPRSKAIG